MAYLKGRSVLSSRGFAGLVATLVAGEINYISRRDLSVHKVYFLQGLTFFCFGVIVSDSDSFVSVVSDSDSYFISSCR